MLCRRFCVPRAGIAATALFAVQAIDAAGPALEERTLRIGRYALDVRLPAGYDIEFLAELDTPRIVHVAGDSLLIGSRGGALYRLDRPYTDPVVLMTLGDYPHSVVVQDSTMYVAQTGSVQRIDWSPDTRQLDPADLDMVVTLPGGRGHSSRTLKAGPDGQLFVSLGLRGNCSDEYLDAGYPESDQRGGVARIDGLPDEPVLAPFATGLRNPVGMDWHPDSGVLFASNNGPDHLGFDVPPESFARLDATSFHGMPWFQFDGEQLFADECITSASPRPMSDVSTPVATFPARSAPMDVMFFDELADDAFFGDALVAIHGSWATDDGSGGGDPATRREPRLALVEFDDGEAVAVHDFVTGFQLADGSRWARPVGVATGPDGAIYFTSDAGVQGLFRLTRTR